MGPIGRRRLRWTGAAVIAVLLLPGWHARLEVVPHEDVLEAARAAPAGAVLGIEVRDPAGRTWHAQYVDRGGARALRALGFAGGIARVLPPDHAALIVDGRPVSYHRVERSLHWPWWRSGGGMHWSD